MHNPDYEHQQQQQETPNRTEGHIRAAARHYDNGSESISNELLAIGIAVVERSPVTPAEFGAWFHFTDIQQTDKTITLTSPNRFMAQWVSSKYAATIAKVTGKKVSIASRK